MILSSFSGLHLSHLAHPRYSPLSQRSNASTNSWEVLSTQHVTVNNSLQIHIQEIFRTKKWEREKRKPLYVITNNTVFNVNTSDFGKLPLYLNKSKNTSLKQYILNSLLSLLKKKSRIFLRYWNCYAPWALNIICLPQHKEANNRIVKIQEILTLGSLGSLSYFQISSYLPQNLPCYPCLSASK